MAFRLPSEQIDCNSFASEDILYFLGQELFDQIKCELGERFLRRFCVTINSSYSWMQTVGRDLCERIYANRVE